MILFFIFSAGRPPADVHGAGGVPGGDALPGPPAVLDRLRRDDQRARTGTAGPGRASPGRADRLAERSGDGLGHGPR